MIHCKYAIRHYFGRAELRNSDEPLPDRCRHCQLTRSQIKAGNDAIKETDRVPSWRRQ